MFIFWNSSLHISANHIREWMVTCWPFRPCAHSFNSPLAKGSRLPHILLEDPTRSAVPVSLLVISLSHMSQCGDCVWLSSADYSLKVPFKSSQEHVGIRMSAVEPPHNSYCPWASHLNSISFCPFSEFGLYFSCGCDKYHDQEQPGQETAISPTLPGHSPSLREVRPGTHEEPGAETTEETTDL